MIDLHSHLLYGVDDGAGSLEDSLNLARLAVQDGIRHMVLTPHIHPGRFDNTRSKLEQKFAAFQKALQIHQIPLSVHLGGEVRLSVEALELILDGEVPFLGTVDGFKIMLLELPHQIIPVGSLQFVTKLIDLGIRPLIAHPERNKGVMSDPTRIRPFVEAGCWLQLTAASVSGHFGEQSYTTACALIEQGWVHVIASDAHNLEHRPPVLSQGRDALTKLVGETMARQMVTDRPARILGVS